MPITSSFDERPALILLPGLDGSAALFAPFIAALGGQVRGVAIAYPATGPQDYLALTNHVRSHIRDEASFVLLGESFSGPIAISLAAERPPGLKGLVLCATFACNPRPLMGIATLLARLLPAISLPTDLIAPLLFERRNTALRAALVAAIAKAGPRVLRDRLRAVTAVDVTTRLSQVDVPCLYLQGAHDRLVPPLAAQHIAAHLPKMRVENVDAPHFLLQSAPVEAAHLVATFLRDLK